MLRVIDAVLRLISPDIPLLAPAKPSYQFAGNFPQHRPWFRKKGVLWFNGFPGWPKLPLVQRRRSASPLSSLNPVAPSAPETEKREESVELSEDPEPLL